MKYLIKKEDKPDKQWWEQLDDQLYWRLYEQFSRRFRRLNLPLYQPFGWQLWPKVDTSSS
jgi:hypothetical protein